MRSDDVKALSQANRRARLSAVLLCLKKKPRPRKRVFLIYGGAAATITASASVAVLPSTTVVFYLDVWLSGPNGCGGKDR